MAVSQFTKRVTTFLHGKTLRMFRFDCADNEEKEAQRLRTIVKEYYKIKPPLGFKAEKD